MYNNIDLHIHTTCSDGHFTPFEIIDIASRNNVDAISICDHDTINAYTKELFEYAKSKNITLVKGVEISTRYYNRGIHVLGYNYDLDNEELNECLSKLQNARVDYLLNVSKKLKEYGYIVNTEHLLTFESVTKAHIALDIVNNKENEALLLKEFNHIPTKGEFIEAIMNEDCPCYVEKFSITPMEATKIIRKANGKVILAHPVCYNKEDNLEVNKIFDLVQLMKADGIEAHYLYLDKNNINANESPFWDKYAKDNNLLSTIGSDFHQLDGIHVELGFKNVDFKISKKEINQIMDTLLNK